MTRRLARSSLGVAALIIGTSACGPTTHYMYTKRGVTTEQRAHDEAACERLSWVTEQAGYGESLRFERNRFTRCMEQRGYRVHTIRQ